MVDAPRGYCYPTDTPEEEECAFGALYLMLLVEAAWRRRCAIRASYDLLRWIVRARAAWPRHPGGFRPPWDAFCDLARRWLRSAASRLWRMTFRSCRGGAHRRAECGN